MRLRSALRCRALLAALLVATVTAGTLAIDIARPQPASAAPVWNDGPLSYTTIINCPSWIGGYPYQEYGMAAGIGSSIDTAAARPTVDDTFEIRVVLAGLGYACTTQRAFVEIALPPGVTPAITAQSPIRCYLDALPVPASNCPQDLGPGSEAGHLSVPAPSAVPFAPAFPYSQDEQLELRIPVKATQTMTNATLRSKIQVTDGQTDPILRPQASITVFPGGGGSTPTPTVSHPTPSTTGVGKTSATSRAQITREGTTGTASFEIGTGGSPSNLRTNVSPTTISAGHSGAISTTWPGVPLQPGTTYTWRVKYAPSGGTPVYGPNQSFTTLSTTTGVVGTGTKASCTESALTQALAHAAGQEGATVSFDCGPDPHVITMPAAQTFDRSVTIDGGGLITLRATGGRHFYITGGTSTVEDITLIDGSSATCGGSIHARDGTNLTLRNVVLRNNQAESGGAVCVAGGANVDLVHVTAVGNVAAHSGGALIAHSGTTVWARWGEWSDNTAAYGGAVRVEYPNSVELGFMTLSDNVGTEQGGAIYSSSGTQNLTLNHITISGNRSKLGGAIRTSGGPTVLAMSSTIADNVTTDPSSAAIHVIESQGSTLGVKVRGTMLIRNSPRSCIDAIETAGNNLSDDTRCDLYWPNDQEGVADPKVGPLAHNGGASRTHALHSGSPAIDKSSNLNCAFNDQRGRYNPVVLPGDSTHRAVDGDGDGTATCDIGSYEYHPTELPGTPTAVAATPGIRSATVSWAAPIVTGNGPITGYRITPYLNGVAQGAVEVGATTLSRTFTGLQPGGTYTFRVAAKNASGVGATSAASSAITLASVPAAVAKPSVSSGTRSATVSWAAPANGGSAITGYTVTPYRNGVAQPAVNVGGAVRSHQITGLDAGVPYTFKVAARNAVGTGPQSVLSNAVTPTAPTGPGDPGDPGGPNPGSPKPPPPHHGFPDVPRSAYFDQAVRWLKAESITSGVGNTGLFKPHEPVSRAQMATFLWRLMGSPSASAGHGFADVPRGAYYDEAVRWLKASGITSGVAPNRFAPNEPVTRAQMAAFLHRLVSSPAVGAGHGFSDVPRGVYYEGAVRWLKAMGITTGVGGTNRFAPHDGVSRAQMAAFLHRLASTPAAWSKVPASKIPPTVNF